MRRGFSLLELLLFISLASIAITIIAAFLITLNRSSRENETRQRVEEDASRIRDTLRTSIQNAQSVQTPESKSKANSLTLVTSNNKEITYTRRNNSLFREGDHEANQRLNRDNVLITDFNAYYLNPQPSQEGDEAVRFDVTAEYDTPDGAPEAFEYQHTQTVNHTVKLNHTPLSNVPDPDNDPLKFWLRADRGVVTDTNGKVARWYDRSGNDYDAAQPDGGNRPSGFVDNAKNGYPVVNFNGGYLAIRDWMYDTANTIDGITIFAVAKSSDTANQILLSFDRNEYFRFSFEDNLDATDGGMKFGTRGESTRDLATDSEYTDGSFYLTDTMFAKTEKPDKHIFVNGEEKASAYQHSGTALGTGTTRYGFVGWGSEASNFNDGGGAASFNGQIAELLVYDTALSEAKRREVRKYLNEKYNLYRTLD